VSREIRELIRQMSQANPLWGAPRIHGELLKLGIDVSQATVSKYMVKPEHRPSRSWQNGYCSLCGKSYSSSTDHPIFNPTTK
jgi:arginine repressor